MHAQIPLLIGCSSTGLITGEEEVEVEAGLALGLFHLPGADLQAIRFTQDQIEEDAHPEFWHGKTGLNREQVNGWLVFADPFHLDRDLWLKGWSEAYVPIPIPIQFPVEKDGARR